LVSDRETNVSELTGDGDNFRNLWLHGIRITEGKSKEMFEKVMLMEVVIALVADSEEVPNFL